MLSISKEWYRKVFEDYVTSKYGCLEVLSKYDTIRDGEIRNYMYKQVAENYHLDTKDISKCMSENGRLCSECINRYRI